MPKKIISDEVVKQFMDMATDATIIELAKKSARSVLTKVYKDKGSLTTEDLQALAQDIYAFAKRRGSAKPKLAKSYEANILEWILSKAKSGAIAMDQIIPQVEEVTAQVAAEVSEGNYDTLNSIRAALNLKPVAPKKKAE